MGPVEPGTIVTSSSRGPKVVPHPLKSTGANASRKCFAGELFLLIQILCHSALGFVLLTDAARTCPAALGTILTLCMMGASTVQCLVEFLGPRSSGSPNRANHGWLNHEGPELLDARPLV